MYFMLNSRPKGPTTLGLLKRVLKLLTDPEIKYVSHYGYLNEPGGVHIIEVDSLEEFRSVLSKFQQTGEVTEVVPLTTHEETVEALKVMIKRREEKGK